MRGYRTFKTANVVVAFARQGVAVDVISRATVVPELQVEDICSRAVETGELFTMPPRKVAHSRDSLHQEIARLRDKLEDSQDLVRELRAARQSDRFALVGVAHMTPKEAILADALLQSGRVSKERLYHTVYGAHLTQDQPQPKIIDVFVCKIRPKLKPHGIEIQTIWGLGYEMLPDSKARLRALAGLPVSESPPLQPALADGFAGAA